MKDENRLHSYMNNGVVEYIMCAAIWVHDGKEYVHKPFNIDKGVVYCGWRHPQILESMPIVFRGVAHTQGFLTNKNRFLDREESLELVQGNGQLTKPTISSKLTSEDLW